MSFLLDTNTVIDFTNRLIPANAVNSIIANPAMSFITRIELLAWPQLNALDKFVYETFINASHVYGCDETIIQQTITIRRQYKIKLPDAFIAATAMTHHLTLLSRNLKDFKNIGNLAVIDPYTL